MHCHHGCFIAFLVHIGRSVGSPLACMGLVYISLTADGRQIVSDDHCSTRAGLLHRQDTEFGISSDGVVVVVVLLWKPYRPGPHYREFK